MKTIFKAIGGFILITSAVATGIWVADELREIDAIEEESQLLEQEWQQMRRDMCASSAFKELEPSSQALYECDELNRP